jgi:predicted nucleotidyltransferase
MPHLSDSQPLTEDELGRINPRVRLTPREQLAMREVFARELPSTAAVYLFGSRTDLNAAGGDIDLLIHVPGIGFDEELALSTRLSDALMARLGERKIDLLITPVADANAKPFVRLALTSAVRLHP